MNTKKKKYPKSFYDDGLGEILEWIDDEVLIHSENKLKRDDEDQDLVIGKGNKKKRQKLAKSGKDQVRKESQAKKLYGDNEISNEIYIPPKRVKVDFANDENGEDDSNQAANKKLEDRARGLINRLAAQTMPFVTSEFEKLYSTNSRSTIDAAIFKNVESSVICKDALTKRKLIAELMLLVSYISHKISQDVGANFVHRLINKFEEFYRTPSTASQSDSYNDDKRLDNILCCLMNLYFIGIISATVIFEITKRICSEDFTPKSIELLLIIIKSVGFQLRKDNPPLMRQLILMAQESSKKLEASSQDIGSRVEFMMEALNAIKNNNSSKLGNYGCDIDKDTIESCLKSLIHRTKLPECLSDATYEDILHSPNWYLLETRMVEQIDSNAETKKVVVKLTTKKEDKICKALGLNKPSEKTIFGALLRSTDFVEACNLIIGFGLNHCSDAMLTSIHVAIHEKKFNPFYFNLINNLCKFNRKYKMAAKFAIQDKIRTLGSMKIERVQIFKKLSLDLIVSDALPITILKAIEWADISSSTKEYLEYLLDEISKLPEEERRKIMVKVEKKSSFANAMRTFINCFMDGCRLFK